MKNQSFIVTNLVTSLSGLQRFLRDCISNIEFLKKKFEPHTHVFNRVFIIEYYTRKGIYRLADTKEYCYCGKSKKEK